MSVKRSHTGFQQIAVEKALQRAHRAPQRRDHVVARGSSEALATSDLNVAGTGIAIEKPCQHGNAELLIRQRETASG